MSKFKNLSGKRKAFFILFSVFSIFIIWFIFYHSAKPAVESSQDSEGLSRLVANIINKLFNTSITSEHTTGYVRIFAHFSEFAALSFCVSSAFESIIQKNKPNVFPALPFTVLIAVTDEIIQIFFDGRAFQVSDILIDSFGGICGIFALWAIIKIYLLKNNNKKS